MDIHTRAGAMNTTMKRLLWLMALLGGVAHANTVTYIYTDPQGTPLAEANTSGVITATFDYAPYGNQAMGAAHDGPGYTGHVNDADTGLVYMQARYYDPTVGRFISVDPVGPNAGSPYNFNRFAYADNNPVVNMDPTGKCTGSLFCGGTGTNIAGHFLTPGSDGGGGEKSAEGQKGVPAGTPRNMKKYFSDTSASGRVNAAKGVMNYYKIDFKGVNVFYSPTLTARAETLKDGPNGDGQLTVGPELFKVSFGYMGAILSHEIEGHWQTQWMNPGIPSGDRQSRDMREVQAYRIELSTSNQHRFGLSRDEIGTEQGMLDRYYNDLTPGNRGMVDSGIYKQL